MTAHVKKNRKYQFWLLIETLLIASQYCRWGIVGRISRLFPEDTRFLGDLHKFPQQEAQRVAEGAEGEHNEGSSAMGRGRQEWSWEIGSRRVPSFHTSRKQPQSSPANGGGPLWKIRSDNTFCTFFFTLFLANEFAIIIVRSFLQPLDRDGDEQLTEDEFSDLPSEGVGLDLREDRQQTVGGSEDRRKEFRHLIDKNKNGKADRTELLVGNKA